MKRDQRQAPAWLTVLGLFFLLLVLVTQCMTVSACYKTGGVWVRAQGAPRRGGYVCVREGR